MTADFSSRRSSAHRRAKRRRVALAWVAAGALVLAGGGTAAALTLGHDEPEEPVAMDLAWIDDLAEVPDELTAAVEQAIDELPEPEPDPEPVEQPEAESKAESTDADVDNPESLTVVVNKQRPLAPIDWEPSDLVMPQGIPNTNGQPVRAEAARALEEMYAAATSAGVPFVITSGYRSYSYQAGLFNDYVARDGVAAAETYSARPGHSEHQTGLAADLDDGSGCAFKSCFGETATGMWLRDNAADYGFILRYHQGSEPVVGYIYEPWHFRYVGTEISKGMRDAGELDLETYLGLDAAPTY